MVMLTPYVSSTQTAVSTPFDNSTNGFIATDVQAAIEETTRYLTDLEVSATGSTSVTTSVAVMNSMTLTPSLAGSYLAWFSCDIESGVAGAAITVQFYVNAVADASSQRKIIPFSGGTLTSGSGRGTVAFQKVLTVTAGQTIDVRWSSSNNGPTAAARTLTLLKVG